MMSLMLCVLDAPGTSAFPFFVLPFAFDGCLLKVQGQVCEILRQISLAMSRAANTPVTLFLFRHADELSSSLEEPNVAAACTGHDPRDAVQFVQVRSEDSGRSFQVRLGAAF